MQRAEKAAIGAAAATRVNDGECIAIDASTTGLHLARALRARGSWNHLTVVTNGLRIASELAGSPGIAVVLPGGWVRWEALSVVGTIGSGVFDRINVQTAFVGAAGFTFETGLSDATEEEAQIKRSMIEVGPRGHRHRRPHEVGPYGLRHLLPDRGADGRHLGPIRP